MAKTRRRLQIGSLNCRGLRNAAKKTQLADDMRAYNIRIMAIQKTHVTTSDVEQIRTTDGKTAYTLYYSGRLGDGNTGV